jgi:hypothetical protein
VGNTSTARTASCIVTTTTTPAASVRQLSSTPALQPPLLLQPLALLRQLLLLLLPLRKLWLLVGKEKRISQPTSSQAAVLQLSPVLPLLLLLLSPLFGQCRSWGRCRQTVPQLQL